MNLNLDNISRNHPTNQNSLTNSNVLLSQGFSTNNGFHISSQRPQHPLLNQNQTYLTDPKITYFPQIPLSLMDSQFYQQLLVYLDNLKFSNHNCLMTSKIDKFNKIQHFFLQTYHKYNMLVDVLQKSFFSYPKFPQTEGLPPWISPLNHSQIADILKKYFRQKQKIKDLLENNLPLAQKLLEKRTQIDNFLDKTIIEYSQRQIAQQDLDEKRLKPKDQSIKYVPFDEQGHMVQVRMEDESTPNKNEYKSFEYPWMKQEEYEIEVVSMQQQKFEKNIEQRQFNAEAKANSIVSRLPQSIYQLFEFIEKNKIYAFRALNTQIIHVAQKMVNLSLSMWGCYTSILSEFMREPLKEDILQRVFTHTFVRVIQNGELLAGNYDAYFQIYDSLVNITFEYLISCQKYLSKIDLLSNQEFNGMITAITRVFLSNIPIKKRIQLCLFCGRILYNANEETQQITTLKQEFMKKLFINKSEITNKMVYDCFQHIEKADFHSDFVEELRLLVTVTVFISQPEGITSLIKAGILQLINRCIQKPINRDATILAIRLFNNLAANNPQLTIQMLKKITFSDLITVFYNNEKDSYLQKDVVGLINTLFQFTNGDSVAKYLIDFDLHSILIHFLYQPLPEEDTRRILNSLLIVRQQSFSVSDAISKNISLFQKMMREERYCEIVKRLM